MQLLKHITASLAGLLFICISAHAADKVDKIVLAGPFASVSNPMIRMIESGALADVASHVEFKVWQNPDQMRALALNGDTDFIATPTNVAANLYNRGVDLKLLNVSVWGILWMISREPDLETLSDFKGKEIAIPFRGDMPDLIFSELAERQGLNLKTDFQLRYVATPLDAMQLLIMRRVDHALLAEPALSMALRKTKSLPAKIIAPELYRSVDLQAEWGRVFNRESKVPQAGIALLNSQLPQHVVKRFIEEYAKATQWCIDNPIEAGKLVAARLPMLTPEAVADAISVSQFDAVSAVDARSELTFFFNLLHQRTPALIGGKLPDNNFYYQ
ncbi:ABC transporter substrate-binding protein [Neptunomonas sp. XY-337]|uniref:ABC transporter substrate-binding protein n=1 Tax=Neptunomonas sp. XY-337 TaxID=2561897 RepID=UPI001980DD9A|nr:ABC transporter substrate-binding protein [Neptunomonas sp. XY-337]